MYIMWVMRVDSSYKASFHADKTPTSHSPEPSTCGFNQISIQSESFLTHFMQQCESQSLNT